MPSLSRAGQTLHYVVQGAGARTVLFAHNLMTNGSIFDGVVSELPGYRTIQVDLRGHGGSSDVQRKFSTADLADDLLAIADHEGAKKLTVVGISLGSEAAMELALKHPDRVEALVLMGATGRAETRGDFIANRGLAAITRLFGMPGILVDKTLPVLFGRTFRRESAEALAHWRGQLRRLDGRGASYAVVCWANRRRLLDHIGAIAAPTLVVVGDEDIPCPLPHGEELRGRIPGAQLVRIATAGHTMTAERPKACAEVIARFLAET